MDFIKRFPRKSLFFAFLLVLLYPYPTFALISSSYQNYSALHLHTNKNQIAPNKSFWIMFHLELKPGWYTYWENPGDSGLPPILNINLPEGFQASSLHFLPPQVIKIGELVDYGYLNNAYYLLEIKAPKEVSTNVVDFHIAMDWITCKDMCIPQSAQIKFSLPVQSNEKLSPENLQMEEKIQFLQTLKTVSGWARILENTIEIKVSLDPNVKAKAPYLFIREENAAKTLISQTWNLDQNILTFTLPKSHEAPNQLTGYLKLNEHDFVRFSIPPEYISYETNNTQHNDFFQALALAFLGGLLLNIMPCVFPILTLKIVSLSKIKAKLVYYRVQHGLFYGLGIMIAFLCLATIIIFLQHLGHRVGWGFQMQSPYFLAIMTYVLFLVSMNLLGFIEFIIPIPLNGHDQTLYSLKSSFMAGLLITLIATPCTAPFMAPAIGFALSQNFVTIYGIFIALGIGLAFPFFIATMIPKLILIIPKPGPWLFRFKQLLAFPMLLSTIWLLWILIKTTHANFVVSVLIGMTLIAFYIWIKLAYPKISKRTTVFLFISTTLLSLSLLYMPWSTNNTPAASYTFARAHLESLLQQEKNLFINVTADWCITCKVNERIVFEDTEVQDFFKKHQIETFTIDWTKPNPEITALLQQFGRSGVPLYIYYFKGKEPIILPQILTKAILFDHLS